MSIDKQKAALIDEIEALKYEGDGDADLGYNECIDDVLRLVGPATRTAPPVPEVTKEMIDAGNKAMWEMGFLNHADDSKVIFLAMIAAQPKEQ